MSAPEGFDYGTRKSGEIELLHHGNQVKLIRDEAAEEFMAKVKGAHGEDLQRVIAEYAGNDGTGPDVHRDSEGNLSAAQEKNTYEHGHRETRYNDK